MATSTAATAATAVPTIDQPGAGGQSDTSGGTAMSRRLERSAGSLMRPPSRRRPPARQPAAQQLAELVGDIAICRDRKHRNGVMQREARGLCAAARDIVGK